MDTTSYLVFSLITQNVVALWEEVDLLEATLVAVGGCEHHRNIVYQLFTIPRGKKNWWVSSNTILELGEEDRNRETYHFVNILI